MGKAKVGVCAGLGQGVDGTRGQGLCWGRPMTKKGLGVLWVWVRLGLEAGLMMNGGVIKERGWPEVLMGLGWVGTVLWECPGVWMGLLTGGGLRKGEAPGWPGVGGM